MKIILVGNPNVGKSVIFGHLTGKYVAVSNYPGTTVEITEGVSKFAGGKYQIVDTPGVNNFIPMSEDETVTRDILLTGTVRNMILVADAKTIRRALFLVVQLVEMRLPFVIALNMYDEIKERGMIINYEKLAEMLGVKVIPTVATEKKGIASLIKALADPAVSPMTFAYEPKIEFAVQDICRLLPDATISKRSFALMWLAGDDSLAKKLSPAQVQEISSIRNGLAAFYQKPLSYLINERRFEKVDEILKEIIKFEPPKRKIILPFLGKITTHPVWGVPVVLAVLFLLYEFVGVFGAGTLVGFMENTVFGQYINKWAVSAVNFLIPWTIFRDFFVGEYGLITMALSYGFAIVLPIVGTFFIAFSILEDSGYLPRLAIMVNRIFKLMGLNGKAVLPLVLGLGCDTMATMTTRILATPKERIITIFLLALAIPCSAQLGVILGMLSAVSFSATICWLAIEITVLLAVGALADRIIPGRRSDFILEIPPIRIPQIGNILIKTFARIKWYLIEVIPLFIIGTAILFILDRVHLLRIIEYVTSPLVQDWLGLPAKATQAFLVGFFRRDYGAAGLYDLLKNGLLNPNQVLVSIVTITLFVPCIANFLMMVRERGLKSALIMISLIFPFAFLVGGLVNHALQLLKISF